jgi:hypothetical protein
MLGPVRTTLAALAVAAISLTASGACAQGRTDTTALLSAEREALTRLAYMDGVWRGPAWTILASGQRHDVTQTERIGPFLDGTVKVIEGRGYDADGKVSFNALGIISYQPDKQAYVLHSYALGYAGDFPLTITPDGYIWQVPAGPAMTIRYTATIGNGTWREVGDRIVAGQAPVRVFEMNLKRIGDTKWPADGTIRPS